MKFISFYWVNSWGVYFLLIRQFFSIETNVATFREFKGLENRSSPPWSPFRLLLSSTTNSFISTYICFMLMCMCLYMCIFAIGVADYAESVSLIKIYFQDVVTNCVIFFMGNWIFVIFLIFFLNRTEAEHVYVVHPRSLRTVSVHPVARHLIVTASTDWYKCSINQLGEVIMIILKYKSI